MLKEEIKENQQEEHRFHCKTIEVNPNLQFSHDPPLTVQQNMIQWHDFMI
jgi:hypothetical protein